MKSNLNYTLVHVEDSNQPRGNITVSLRGWIKGKYLLFFIFNYWQSSNEIPYVTKLKVEIYHSSTMKSPHISRSINDHSTYVP